MIIASLRPIRPEVALLRDGSAVELRPAQDGDRPALRQFLENVSRDSLSLRFFGVPKLEHAADLLATDGDAGDFGLVACSGVAGRIVAHAGCWLVGEDRGEVAFLVADAWQGRGLASIMLAELVEQARRRGIARLRAEVLPHNQRMVDVFVRSGRVTAIRDCGEERAVELAVPAPTFAFAHAA